MNSARWTCAGRVVAGLTLANATLDLLVWTMGRPSGAIDSLPGLALLGLLSGALAWRGQAAGHGAALLFYGAQLAGFHPYDASHATPLRGAFSLAFVVHLPAGVLIVNAFAIAVLSASAALLWRRLRTRDGNEHQALGRVK